jgi:alkanesulfonate monooxygenase SsuD/methylene tetrahydromethanopterin reductase-like flavin-dependent oxidoreductase (luciferase family)
VSPPTIGLFAVNSHACADPEAAARVAGLAERLGYDSLWAGEHVVVPSPRVDPSPMEPDEPILDPLVALAHLAARTERIRLGTGVILLPQRNPVVLAKQVASLDVLSGGRLILGIGVAYLEPEMRAVGVPMEGRGARADDYLAAMRALWEQEAPAYEGRHVRFEGVDALTAGNQVKWSTNAPIQHAIGPRGPKTSPYRTELDQVLSRRCGTLVAQAHAAGSTRMSSSPIRSLAWTG